MNYYLIGLCQFSCGGVFIGLFGATKNIMYFVMSICFWSAGLTWIIISIVDSNKKRKDLKNKIEITLKENSNKKKVINKEEKQEDISQFIK